MAPRTSLKSAESAIAKQIAALKKKQESLRAKHRLPIIKKIVQQMRDFEISVEDLQEALNKGVRRSRSTSPAAKNVERKAVAPKYRHPDTGETWSGRGKPPRWLSAAEAEGAKREQFLIAS